MDVHVKDRRWLDVVDNQSRLFERFAHRCLFGTLAGVHVTARLDPDAEQSVTQQDDPARGDRKRGRGDVVIIDPWIKEVSRPVKTIERRRDGRSLALVNAVNGAHLVV
jgi:hypothetical protein